MLRKILPVALVLLAVTLAVAQIPAGTPVTVRIGSEISSGSAKVGNTFDGTLAKTSLPAEKPLPKRAARSVAR